VLSAKGVFEESGDALIEGANIKSGSAVYDWKDRFQTYRVNSQMPSFGDGADDPLHAEIGEARDTNVMRHRPLIVNSEAWATPEATRIRAENECCCRAGKSTRVNIQVTGWRQSSGKLWKPGLKVSVTSPALYRLDNADMVISTVRYTYSDGDGAVAELELTRPDVYLDTGAGEVKEDPFGL
jgi:prophage tail gpP-like protein